jgi:hypothetical protein
MADERSRDLVRRQHGLVVPEQASRSTRTVGFESPALGWDDLPEAVRKAAAHKGAVVTEQAGLDDGVVRGSDGPVEVLRAWRAYRDRIYVAVAERPVLIGSRAVVPAGAWRGVSLQRDDIDEPPQRRIGWLGAGVLDHATAQPSVAPAVPVAPGAPRHQASAARVWPFLPAAVREGATRAVPVPDDWLGDLSQVTRGDGMPVSQELSVLRRDARSAVVVRAIREVVPRAGCTADEQERALAGADWLVEQVTYSLRQRAQLSGTRAGSRWSW